jgi:hypothetical protein
MGKGLEYSVARQDSSGMKRSYVSGSPSNYLQAGKDVSQKSYSKTVPVLENYFSALNSCLNRYLDEGLNGYLRRLSNDEGAYKSNALGRRKDMKLRCLKCGAEIDILGNCERCGWNLHLENEKKGILYDG